MIAQDSTPTPDRCNPDGLNDDAILFPKYALTDRDKQDAYKIMDTGGRGPSYWRTLEGYPKLVELVSEIKWDYTLECRTVKKAKVNIEKAYWLIKVSNNKNKQGCNCNG